MQPVNKTRNDLWMTLDNSWASRFYKRDPVSLVLNYKVFLNRLQQQQPNEISSFALFHNKGSVKKRFTMVTHWAGLQYMDVEQKIAGWCYTIHLSYSLQFPPSLLFLLVPICMSNAPIPSIHYSILLISFTAF